MGWERSGLLVCCAVCLDEIPVRVRVLAPVDPVGDALLEHARERPPAGPFPNRGQESSEVVPNL